MKIVYDNIIFSLQKSGGASVYWMEFISRVKNKNIIFYEQPNQNLFAKMIDYSKVEESKLPIKILRYLPFMKSVEKNSIFHSSHYRVSFSYRVKNITTVHDFTYEYYVKGLARFVHTLQKRFAIYFSDGVICISENTKRDLIKFCPFVNQKKIKVIYNGISEQFSILENKQQLLNKNFPELKDSKYFLFVGDRSAYKRFDIVLELLNKLQNINLVIVGGKDFNPIEETAIYNMKERIFHTRGIGIDKLNILYNNADFLLYPSQYEGFGIPVIEAMRSGCPVIASNFSSIPEISLGNALLVDKMIIDEFIQKIELLNDEYFRNNLIKNAYEHSFKFSWNKCFDETFDFYKEISKVQR